MTRGNQRELARAKSQKKEQDKQKRKGAKESGANAGTKLEDRRHRDAEVMRVKQQKAEEKKVAEQAGASKK